MELKETLQLHTNANLKRVINVNEHRLYVEVYGSPYAPAIVLLHHGLGSVRSWKAQITPLSMDYRLIIYDRWGYGKSEARSKLSVPYFNEDLQDLIVLLDRLDVERASLVGHSDGGTLALYFSAQYPERVNHLITVAAHIYIEPKTETGIVNLRNNYENDEPFREALSRIHGDKSEAVFYNWYNGWVKGDNRNWDMRPILNKITTPTLVIQGTKDEHASPQHARDIANNIPGAKLWLAQGARHLLPSEEPEIFNKKLLDYLRDNTSEMLNGQVS
jgi:pimeloyl-ACP methyl ester carboxylesterase